jgi:hypothetical protein
MTPAASRPCPTRLLMALSLFAALGLPSCKSTTAPTASGAATLVVTVVPDPIVATNTLNPAVFDYDISWKVTITDTGGVGGSLNFVTGHLYDPLTGQPANSTILDKNDLLVLFGQDHIPPNGTITVQQQLSYRLAERGRQAILSVEVQMLDDNSNVINQGGLVQVQ